MKAKFDSFDLHAVQVGTEFGFISCDKRKICF